MRYRWSSVVGGSHADGKLFANALRGICVDAAGSLLAVGDSEVKVLRADGRLLRGWATERPGYSVAVAPDGRVLVGEVGQVETFTPSGRREAVLRDRERIGRPTALAVTANDLLIGDAVHRVISRFDRDGRFVRVIGADSPTRGFAIPTKCVDFVLDAEGMILAAHPGKHRVERYDLDGRLLGRLGRFTGPDPRGFSGCCNPTNVALDPEGRVLVTVKAPPGVKALDGRGELVEVFGADAFDPACRTLDLAVDHTGRVFVADAVRSRVCVFTPESTGRPAAVGAAPAGGNDR